MTTTLPSRVSQGLAAVRRRELSPAVHVEVDELHNRFSNDFHAEWIMPPFAPPTDVSETDGAVQVWIDVPGMDPQDIDVQVAGNTLQVTGERKKDREGTGKIWHKVERCTGEFSRTVRLPCAVQDDNVKADYKHGVLIVTLPKTGEAKPHHVTIAANGE